MSAFTQSIHPSHHAARYKLLSGILPVWIKSLLYPTSISMARHKSSYLVTGKYSWIHFFLRALNGTQKGAYKIWASVTDSFPRDNNRYATSLHIGKYNVNAILFRTWSLAAIFYCLQINVPTFQRDKAIKYVKWISEMNVLLSLFNVFQWLKN